MLKSNTITVTNFAIVLGIWFDRKMNWKVYIKKVAESCSSSSKIREAIEGRE